MQSSRGLNVRATPSKPPSSGISKVGLNSYLNNNAGTLAALNQSAMGGERPRLALPAALPPQLPPVATGQSRRNSGVQSSGPSLQDQHHQHARPSKRSSEGPRGMSPILQPRSQSMTSEESPVSSAPHHASAVRRSSLPEAAKMRSIAAAEARLASVASGRQELPSNQLPAQQEPPRRKNGFFSFGRSSRAGATTPRQQSGLSRVFSGLGRILSRLFSSKDDSLTDKKGVATRAQTTPRLKWNLPAEADGTGHPQASSGSSGTAKPAASASRKSMGRPNLDADLRAADASYTGGNGRMRGKDSSYSGAVQAPEPTLSGNGSSLATAVVERDNSNRTGIDDFRLSIKVLCAVGTLFTYHVGYQDCGPQPQGPVPAGKKDPGRWEFFMGDGSPALGSEGQERAPGSVGSASFRPPMQQLIDLEPFASKQEVVMSREVCQLVGTAVRAEPLGAGSAAYRLDSFEIDPRLRLPSAAIHAAKMPVLPSAGATSIYLESIKAHVPRCVSASIRDGHREFASEVRYCSCAFFGFPGLLDGTSSQEEAVQRIQKAFEVVDKAMAIYEGEFMQFRCDEKGFLAVCCFGLMGKTHKDDSTRALHSALSVCQKMGNAGLRACAGVTTGILLCAFVVRTPV